MAGESRRLGFRFTLLYDLMVGRALTRTLSATDRPTELEVDYSTLDSFVSHLHTDHAGDIAWNAPVPG